MAKFNYNAIDETIADMAKLERLDNDTKYRILEAGGAVLTDALQDVIRRLGLMNPTAPQLINSLKAVRKMGDQGVFVRISPKGKRKETRKHGKRMKKMKDGRRASSGSYAGTNAEVAYYLEYGTPRIKATHWMETGVEESNDATFEAMQNEFNTILDEMNL